MKVLHVININSFGGAEKLIPVFLPAQKNAGIEVECLIFHHHSMPDAAKQIATDLERNNITVHLMGYQKIYEKPIRNHILSITQDGNFNLVHSHLKYADLWMSLLKRKKHFKLPVVTTLHGYRDSYQNKFGLDFKRQILFTTYYWLTRFVLRRMNGIIFISNCLKEFYRKSGLLGKKKNAVIHHGYSAKGNQLETIIPRSEQITAPKIVLPGRLIKMKGHHYAIRVMSILKEEYPGSTLHIFGQGPAEAEIRAAVKAAGLENSILFYGYVNNVQERLKEMDIVLIPSQGESFGMVFLEAFAAGVPVVAFDLPAGNEIITDGENGLLALPGNASSLAEKTKHLCKDVDLYNRIRKNALADIEGKFSLARMAKEYRQFYSTILESAN